MGGSIIIANTVIPVEAEVITWRENGWDASATRCIPLPGYASTMAKCVTVGNGQRGEHGSVMRHSYREALGSQRKNPTLAAAQAVIRQFIVHHDGVDNSETCFNVLHNERGLSCHFLIDNDGMIYQTLDLAFAGWHAADWNPYSIGVEFANRGDAKAWPGYYEGKSARRGPSRQTQACQINGHKILAYEFTQKQRDAFRALALSLQRILPNLPLEYPQSSPGTQAWTTLPQADSHAFSGYMGHYHLTQQKWDPGPFDFKEILSGIRGRFSLPIFWFEPKPGDDAPYVPKDKADLDAASAKLEQLNIHAESGYFPVGPWGESRLWHGGIHLAGKRGQPVYAAFPGRIVAARMGADTTNGSNNFLLVRHDLALGQLKVPFYALYMHLADVTKSGTPPEWLRASKQWAKDYKAGEVLLLDEPVIAASRLGEMGTAGPPGREAAQLHLEIFSVGDLFSTLPNTPWEIIDGTSGGRFCDVARVNDLIDSDRDGLLERSELSSFFASGGTAQTRNFVTFHVSTWTAEPSWSEQLRLPADFKEYSPQQIHELVAEQITPGLWWDKRVAAHAKLPADGIVYHYNPIAFVSWFNTQLIQFGGQQVTVDKDATSKVPDGITDDRDGGQMASAPEVKDDACNKSITLEQLVLGFDSPDCTL